MNRKDNADDRKEGNGVMERIFSLVRGTVRIPIMSEAQPSKNGNTPEKVCPSCGQVNPATAGICWKCGRSIKDAAKVSPASSPATGKRPDTSG